MKVVYIHGRDQQGKDPVALREEWDSSLQKGLEKAGLTRPVGTETVFPYYGNTLIALIAEAARSERPVVRRRGEAPTDAELEFRERTFREVATALGITDEEMAAAYQGQPHAQGILNAAWVHSLLAAIDAKTPLGGAVLDAITHDVFAYLRVRRVRREVDCIVEEAIPAERCVVVAHSLGTIVGFNVLRAASRLQIQRYITVGSPLGIRSIQAELEKPFRMPASVRDWKNAMDERDVVALHPLDATYFPIDPSIENKVDVDNWTDNRHGIAGYLSDAIVARWIHDALCA